MSVFKEIHSNRPVSVAKTNLINREDLYQSPRLYLLNVANCGEVSALTNNGVLPKNTVLIKPISVDLAAQLDNQVWNNTLQIE